MIRKLSLLVLIMAAITTSCQFGNKSGNSGDAEADKQKAEVREVIQTTTYTYLRVDKNDREEWIAITRQDFNKGDIVYYEDGLEMKNFESPELKRTFERVLFVMEISDEPLQHGTHGGMGGMGGSGMTGEMEGTTPQKPVISKLDIKIDQPEGGTTIGTLYSKRDSFGGKMVTVKGQVTKVNLGIMGRNWIHIQDGTSDGDYFDLTVTTEETAQNGDIVTFSGVLGLNRDFGAGYTYELILEDAVVLKQQ